MNSQVIEVVHFEEGKQSLVGVPLAGSKLRAILLKSDFHHLMSLGVSTSEWKLYHKQVVARNNRWYVSVGRMIRNADKNQKVIPKDGNPLNLRRENLIVAPGRAKFRARMKQKRSDVKRNRVASGRQHPRSATTLARSPAADTCAPALRASLPLRSRPLDLVKR